MVLIHVTQNALETVIVHATGSQAIVQRAVKQNTMDHYVISDAHPNVLMLDAIKFMVNVLAV